MREIKSSPWTEAPLGSGTGSELFINTLADTVGGGEIHFFSLVIKPAFDTVRGVA